MAIPGNVGVKKQITSIPSGPRFSGPPDANKRLAAERQRTREKFFDNRQDVSSNRLDRRLLQNQLYEEFKADPTKTKLVKGTSNLYQAATPGGKTLAEKQMELANKYGPTFKEIGSDIGYGIGTFAKAAGNVIMSGDFGLIGLAKGLYEKATTSAAKAKEAVVQGVEKLSDIDLEILKNKDKGKYKFTSKKPEIQQIDALEQEEKGALGLVDAAGKNLDVSSLNATQLATYNMLTKKANPLSHQQALDQVKTQFLDNRSPSQRLEERLGDSQVNLQDIYMQGQKIYDPISVTGNQTMTAGLDESLLPKPIQAGLSTLRGIGETPYGTFGLDDIISGKPSLTFEKDIFGGTLGATADPFRNQYGFEFSKSFKDGGSVDDKLNNIQKSSNNMYGTGILSAR